MAAYHSTEPACTEHWQDFNSPITIGACQAGHLYRAIYSIKSTLRLVADHHLRSNSHGALPQRMSSTEIEAMLSGSLALARMMESAFEDLHA